MNAYIQFRYTLLTIIMFYPCAMSIFFTIFKVIFRKERNYVNTIIDYIINIFTIFAGACISGLSLAEKGTYMEFIALGYTMMVLLLFIYELHLLCKYERENKSLM